jgi:hypothetical protein
MKEPNASLAYIVRGGVIVNPFFFFLFYNPFFKA